MKPLRYPQYPESHISNVEQGDKINTPMGIEIVQWCNDVRFSTYKSDEKGNIIVKGHYGYVPYFESQNEKIFSRILWNTESKQLL